MVNIIFFIFFLTIENYRKFYKYLYNYLGKKPEMKELITGENLLIKNQL
jgi:hypothetical protein